VDLPAVPSDLPGTAKPTLVVAIDRKGQIYYESQAVTNLADLRERLQAAVHQTKEPPALEVQADKTASFETALPVLSLAAELGLGEARLAVQPRPEPVIKARRR
jgi:biopolymer transport protein ExbD